MVRPNSVPKQTSPRLCYRCGQQGHLARNCQQNGRSTGAEASGRSGSGPTSRNSVVKSIPRPGELSEEQLESLLAQRRLEHEQSLLTEGCSSTNSVTASEKSYQTVEPTVYIDLLMDGESVRTMVDMGAQSTIISRSMLHAIGQQAKAARRPWNGIHTQKALLLTVWLNEQRHTSRLTISLQSDLELSSNVKASACLQLLPSFP